MALELAVVMVELGNCAFSTKVRNIQMIGGSAAFIGGHSELVGKHDRQKESEDALKDDGSGHSITIPSFLISEQAAQAFRRTYSNGEHIILKVDIEMPKASEHLVSPNQDDVPIVELWFSTPFDFDTYQLHSIGENLHALGDRVNVELHIMTKSCLKCPQEEQEKECFSRGMFCPFRPTQHYVEPKFMTMLNEIEGHSILSQTLLVKCVHMISMESDIEKKTTRSLHYMVDYLEKCHDSKQAVSEFDCAFD